MEGVQSLGVHTVGQPRKVAKLLELAKLDESCAMLVRGYVDQAMASAMAAGNTRIANNVEVQKRFMEYLQPIIIAKLKGLCGELFTDEVLDKLIEFYTSPAAQVFHGATPDILSALIEHLADIKLELDTALAHIVRDVHRSG